MNSTPQGETKGRPILPEKTTLMVDGRVFYVHSYRSEGGSGGVWKIVDDNGCPYALKLAYKLDESRTGELFSKLPVLKEIKYDHIVPILHFGRLPVIENGPLLADNLWRSSKKQGLPFWIMPYAQSNLEEYLASTEDVEERLGLAVQLCFALRRVHSYLALGPDGNTERFFHGNLKPANILLFSRRKHYSLKIADLGMGPLQDSPYLAPEQRQNAAVDFRCDLFAVARILRELAGRDADLEALLREMEQPRPEDRSNELKEIVKTLSQEQSRLLEKRMAYNHFLLGAQLYEAGHYDYALKDFEQAVALDPSLFIAFFYRANALKALDKPEEALSSYGEALKLNMSDPRLYENRGELYASLDRHREAVEDFEKALSLDPEAASAHGSLGLVYLQLGEHQKALTQFDRLIAITSDFAPAYVDRGDALVALRQFESAIRDYGKALELEIESPEEVREKLRHAQEMAAGS